MLPRSDTLRVTSPVPPFAPADLFHQAKNSTNSISPPPSISMSSIASVSSLKRQANCQQVVTHEQADSWQGARSKEQGARSKHLSICARNSQYCTLDRVCTHVSFSRFPSRPASSPISLRSSAPLPSSSISQKSAYKKGEQSVNICPQIARQTTSNGGLRVLTRNRSSRPSSSTLTRI